MARPSDSSHPEETAFDMRARAELALAFEPGQPPPNLLRHTALLARRGVQRSVIALLLFGTGVGGELAMRPPELVRGAIEHENHERTLRGQPGGQTLVLVAEQKKALAIAHAQFARQPG